MEDSTPLSKLSLYLFMPAIIINAFNIRVTREITRGLIVAFVVAIAIHMVLLLIDGIVKKSFRATSVERASIIYSNAGNLIVPIITYIFGEEWLIYASAYLIVQIVFLWTHGVQLFSEQKSCLKKILLNVNVIAVFVGFVMMIFNLRLPAFVGEITAPLGNMLAPTGMIIAGMLAAGVDFGKMLKNKRLYLVSAARLVICPVIVLILFKGIMAFVVDSHIRTVMMISYLASITPSASTIMQFAQLYGKEADYATALNVVTTIGCILTMPLLILFF